MCMSREHVQIQLVFKSGSFLGEKTFPNTKRNYFFACVFSRMTFSLSSVFGRVYRIFFFSLFDKDYDFRLSEQPEKP